jgi:hypothetical protein
MAMFKHSPIVIAVLTVLAACSSVDGGRGDQTEAEADDSPSTTTKAICPPGAGRIRCYARRVTSRDGRPVHAESTPSGFGAKDIADAYALDTSTDPHATIAIADAYGYERAEADLAVYRRQYDLPPCTVASGCLTIVNQRGETSPLPPEPPDEADWRFETALDLDMASAACPKCKLLLIQSDRDQDPGLFEVQPVAARLGATVISDSWGAVEGKYGPAPGNEHYFDLNVGIFAAGGDEGYNQSDGETGPSYPATSAFVTAVGGTVLTKSAGGRGWTETTWSGSGSNCSRSIAKPGWQTVSSSCRFRAASDVAAVAQGVATYNKSGGGWSTALGTSVSAPIVAGIYALTGHASDGPALAYRHPEAYFDTTRGSNGSCGSVLCKAGVGWDGPTGVGSPNGAVLATIH